MKYSSLSSVVESLSATAKATLSPSYYFDLSSFRHASLFQDVVLVWDVLPKIKDYLNTTKLGLLEGDISPHAWLINPETISIGKGTVMEPGVYIKGPCIIGENCSIRHGAYIRGNVIVGDRCVIGHDTEIKNTVLLNDAHAAHFAYLGDCILGNNVNLGAGTKCANLRLDMGQISIRVESVKLMTGLKKFGAIVGDNTHLGCNSVSNPGSLIGQNVKTYPCTNYGGLILSESVVKS